MHGAWLLNWSRNPSGAMPSMQRTRPNRQTVVIAVIAIGFVAWSASFIYRSSFVAIDGRRYFCLFDDAMISMRYAWNFSHGLGLVWNPG